MTTGKVNLDEIWRKTCSRGTSFTTKPTRSHQELNLILCDEVRAGHGHLTL
jgi:hypothetical protein